MTSFVTSSTSLSVCCFFGSIVDSGPSSVTRLPFRPSLRASLCEPPADLPSTPRIVQCSHDPEQSIRHEQNLHSLPFLSSAAPPPPQPQPHPRITLTATPNITRRACLRFLALTTFMPPLAAVPSSDPFPSADKWTPRPAAPRTTIVNSVLSAYGLPTLRDVAGFSVFAQQYGRLVVRFRHPSAWVVSNRSQAAASGDGCLLTVSDYRRAEGVALYVVRQGGGRVGVRDVAMLSRDFLLGVVTPGDATAVKGRGDVRVVADRVVGGGDGDGDGDNGAIGQGRLLETVYESVTPSGYSVGRRARTKVFMLPDGRVCALCVSCSDVRWKKVRQIVDECMESFAVFVV